MIINENDTTGYFSPEEQAEYERILDEQYKDTGIKINEMSYVVDYGKKVKQAEELFNFLASQASTYLYLTNPNGEPIPIQSGCKLTFVQLGSISEE